MSKKLINTLKLDIKSNVSSFESRKHLFDFGIDSDMSLNEFKAIPDLKEEFNQNKRNINMNLKEGYYEASKNNKLVTNFDDYRKQTWIYFLTCLKKNNTIVEEKPHFVTLAPLICDFTTVEEWGFTFYAIKFQGVIYLLRNHSSLEMGNTVSRVDQPYNYYGVKFWDLITSGSDSEINGFESCQGVDRIDCNGKRLIVCYGVNCNDKNGNPVYGKLRQVKNHSLGSELKQKLLYDWSHCIISGVTTLVRGRRNGSNLHNVDVIDVQTIPDMCRSYWTPSKCLSFVDQSLEFVKSCVESEPQLFEFSVNSNDKTLSSSKHESDHSSQHFLPQFYTQ